MIAVPHQEPVVIKQDDYFNVGEAFEVYLRHSYQPEVEEMFCNLVRRTGPVRRLLDIGCASGRTSAFTKRHGVEELVGIEIDPRAVEIARRHMDDVVLADVAQAELSYPDDYFDMLFFTDVLEHLIDPWSTLERYLRKLRPGGHALIVLPNFGHVEVISGLITGLLRYQQSGIMDSGHLRIFTQTMAVEMIEKAGLKLEQITYRLDGDDWRRYEHADAIPLPANAGHLMLDSSRVPRLMKMSYFVRKFHFLTRRPEA